MCSVDDTTILFVLEEDNMDHLMAKLDFFSAASVSEISIFKSSLLGWDLSPPPRCNISYCLVDHYML